MNSKDFNANWICRVDWQEIHCLIGYNNLISLLDDRAKEILNRLSVYKGEKLVIKPFHGSVITFYAR